MAEKQTAKLVLPGGKEASLPVIVGTEDEHQRQLRYQSAHTHNSQDKRRKVHDHNDGKGPVANHYNLLRTIEDMYSLPHAGAAADAQPITGVWA